MEIYNMSFKNFFKILLGTKAHPAHLPYIPTPPSHQQEVASPNRFPNNDNTDLSYTETEASIHTFAETNIGVSFSTVNRWENGKGKPSLIG